MLEKLRQHLLTKLVYLLHDERVSCLVPADDAIEFWVRYKVEGLNEEGGYVYVCVGPTVCFVKWLSLQWLPPKLVLRDCLIGIMA